MESVFEKDFTVMPSMADHTARLGLHNTFGVFMDAASEHAEALGVGYRAMIAKDLFWLTVRTRIQFAERPHIGETAVIRTWPEPPGRIRSNRSYELVMNGRTVIRGRTEWAMFNVRLGTVVPMDGVFPEGLAFVPQSAIDEPFCRVPDSFGDAAPYGEYTVRSADIDIGGHLNNAALVRALIGSFSLAELDRLDIRDIDVCFRRPSFEGDRLVFQRRAAENALEVRVSRGEETVLLARIG